MVIINIISSYLESNRRITLPGLGTFISKGDISNGDRGAILFSEFLKSDDGLLRTLLVEQGLNEVEATDSIESFVAEVRRVLASGGQYELPMLGRLYLSDGVVTFDNEPALQLEQESEQEPMPDESKIDLGVSAEDEARMVDSILSSLEDRDDEGEDDEESVDVKQKIDVWLIIALAAGLIALFALIYGLIVEWQIGNISFGGAIDDMLYGIFG